ncbi:MAG TPA: hypothetical protein VJR89_28995, partial [Polyangiales bacterium]|nr:hypothetical protein [Polyangiales bacterium]
MRCVYVSLIVLGGLGCATSAESEEVSEPDDPCAEQIEASRDGLPEDLSCTGLFEDMKRGKLGKGVVPFEPAFALWSDGAGKTRWIKLPEDEGIDSSDMGHWRYPEGTTFWKEFRADGARVETRMFRKDRADHWVHTTYLWNEKGTAAKRLDGGKQLTRNGVDYVIPKSNQCDDCHDGQPDNVLGFSAVSLGLGDQDREGWTMRKLMDEARLTDVPVE